MIRTSLALLIVLSGASASFAESYLSAKQARAEQATLLSEGANIVSLTGADISGASCDGLTSVRNVEDAGAVMTLGQATLSPGDLSTYFVYEVTPGFFQVMAQPGANVAGNVFVDQDTAAILGISRESRRQLQFVTSTGSIATNPPPFTAEIDVVDLAPRASYYEGSIFIIGPASGAYTTCYAAVRYPASADLPPVLAAELAEHGQASQASWLGSFSGSETPLESYLSRPSRWTWLIAGAVTAIVFCILFWVRGPEFALYRSIGATFWVILYLTMSECLALALIAAVVWPAPLVVLHLFTSAPVVIPAVVAGLASELGYLITAVVIGSILTAAVAMLGSPWEQFRRE